LSFPGASRGFRWVAAVAAMVVVMGGLALGQRGVIALRAHWAAPTGPARWIWAGRDVRDPYPTSFQAARDFYLEAVPERARLLALADEEYVVFLNGQRVGADGYHAGARMDAFEVAPLLLAGGNRLAVELRSSHGGGGFLASLEDVASGRFLVVTDRRWRTVDRYSPGLAGGWLSLEREGRPVHVWGLPPLGRWGWPVEGGTQPLFAELTGAMPVLAGLTGGVESEAAGAGAGRPPALRPRAARSPRPGYVELDWGREVEGYLVIETGYEPGLPAAQARPPAGEIRLALLYTGTAAAPAGGGRPAAEVLLMPGAREWQDVHPRRFRYCLLVGLERPLTARVHAVDPAAAAPLMVGATPPDQPDKGVFGLRPPPLHTPVEDGVARELERLERAAAAAEAKAKGPG
jgi:hypothetical protein